MAAHCMCWWWVVNLKYTVLEMFQTKLHYCLYPYRFKIAAKSLNCVQMFPLCLYVVGFDALLDDDHLGLLANTKSENAYHIFLVFLQKLIVPIFLALTIFLNWGHPLIIAAKVTLILFTTKPSPLSIYLFVEEVRIYMLLFLMFREF